MRFRRWVGIALVVLLWGNLAAARRDGSQSGIAVLVYNHAQVPALVLSQAEVEASRIYRSAGIAIQWVECWRGDGIDSDACHGAPGTNQFVLNIVPDGKTSSDLVFGLAFLGQDGGRYCDVFFDRIEQAQGKLGVKLSDLLGTVAAHELGHLLLGSHAHAYAGIMSRVWGMENLHQLNMGNLLFSRDQVSHMKGRIRDDEVKFVSVNTKLGKIRLGKIEY
jgi:hypothetical protein